MGVATRNRDFMACPRCGSEDLYRSRGRGIYERIVLRVFDRYPYRCKQCGARFYTKRPKLCFVSSPDSHR
jgi:DNA-directed RNA polymerase subunit RPC12/RpoP